MCFKRRQVIKDPSQTEIPFPQAKNYQGTNSLHQEYQKINDIKSNGYNMNTIKDTASPFRSFNRVKNLLRQSPFQPQYGSSKFIETPTQSFLNKVGSINDFSRPSSATTACTYSPNEYSVIRSDRTKVTKRKRDVKGEKKGQNQSNQLIGKKRPAQMTLDQMEYFLRLHSRNAKFLVQKLKLRDKKTGQTYDFPLYQESQILNDNLANSIITSFDMTKLEVEYDYDTDDEQICHSKKMLLKDLFMAIDYFIKEEPLKLVDNLLL